MRLQSPKVQCPRGQRGPDIVRCKAKVSKGVSESQKSGLEARLYFDCLHSSFRFHSQYTFGLHMRENHDEQVESLSLQWKSYQRRPMWRAVCSVLQYNKLVGFIDRTIP